MTSGGPPLPLKCAQNLFSLGSHPFPSGNRGSEWFTLLTNRWNHLLPSTRESLPSAWGSGLFSRSWPKSPVFHWLSQWRYFTHQRTSGAPSTEGAKQSDVSPPMPLIATWLLTWLGKSLERVKKEETRSGLLESIACSPRRRLQFFLTLFRQPFEQQRQNGLAFLAFVWLRLMKARMARWWFAKGLSS